MTTRPPRLEHSDTQPTLLAMPRSPEVSCWQMTNTSRNQRNNEMIILKTAIKNVAPVLTIAVTLLSANAALAQSAARACPPARVIPLAGPEPPAKLAIEPPLPEPLASRGVAVIAYCAENLHIAPVFGAGALTVSPRVGHIHVTVDDAPWHWADASGNPIILQRLASGSHRVLIELVNANHQVIDKGTIVFDVPQRPR
jgi:hypothetical protein